MAMKFPLGVENTFPPPMESRIPPHFYRKCRISKKPSHQGPHEHGRVRYAAISAPRRGLMEPEEESITSSMFLDITKISFNLFQNWLCAGLEKIQSRTNAFRISMVGRNGKIILLHYSNNNEKKEQILNNIYYIRFTSTSLLYI